MCAFKLSTGDSKKIYTGRLATPEQVKNQEMRGLTHIPYEGESHFLYIESDADRNKLKDDLNLFNYEWFHEETGKKNWTLYNVEQYKIDRNIKGKRVLTFNKEQYKGSKLEVPINASSCCGMFSWCTIPDNLILSKKFDTKYITDMSLMFAGCVFPRNFEFNAEFDTSNVEDMRYMFYECPLPEGFRLNEKFDTSKVKDMEFMFSRTKLPQNFTLPDDFDTAHVTDMNHMFYEAIIPVTFDFGINFTISPNANTDCMFLGCNINNTVIGAEQNNFAYIKTILKNS